MRRLLDQALTRATGTRVVAGNTVRLLRDARENYPAWLDAIRGARRHVYFESYIVHDDEIGRTFAAALADKARDGVRVRLVYDWMGAIGATGRRFWRRLARSGVEVRCFNPPRLVDPFGWLSRDHRKSIAVDGEVAFVAGLCVGDAWVGNAQKGREPWRDTGIELRGPAVADVERAFAQVWRTTGAPLPRHERTTRATRRNVGETHVRIVANRPGTAGLFRLDQIVAAAARETLWLTDAYFAGFPPYVAALRAAARDGVDVRLLVPGASDIPLLQPVSRAGYGPLLSAGVRLFEWNGPMLHAKTAVADTRWSRVGSSNLNVASWLGNYELDAVIEEEGFARAMQGMYLDDLSNATEIVLERGATRRVTPARKPVRAGGSASRIAAASMRVGHAVGAAMTPRRGLALPDRRLLLIVALLSGTLALTFTRWPRAASVPLVVLLAWTSIALVLRALRRSASPTRLPVARQPRTGAPRIRS